MSSLEPVATPIEDTVIQTTRDAPKITATRPKDERAYPHLENMCRTLRRYIITMLAEAGSEHPDSSLSAVEIMTCLFFHTLRHCPNDPLWPERDQFVLSKGHAVPLLYATLTESGYFSAGDLNTLIKMNSHLRNHADSTLVKGIEMSSGSLGQGLSFGVGATLAARLDKHDHRVYVLLGDEECDEGQLWEAAMAAAHFNLNNLIAIVDHNNQQLDGLTRGIMNIDPLPEKWTSFGWHTIEVDGHDCTQIIAAFEQAFLTAKRPTAIIAHTIKGKGMSFMEHNRAFHGKVPKESYRQH